MSQNDTDDSTLPDFLKNTISTKEMVAGRKLTERAVEKWAAKNDVAFVYIGGRKNYRWTVNDNIKFSNRKYTPRIQKTNIIVLNLS